MSITDRGSHFLLIVMALGCLAAYPCWSGPGDNPIEFTRPDGTHGAFQPKVKLDASLQAMLNETNTEGTLSLSTFFTGSSSGSRSRITADSIAIFLELNDPFLMRTAISLVQGLDDLPHFQTIRIYPYGQKLAPGEKNPSMFLRLDRRKEKNEEHIHMIGGMSYLGSINPQYYELSVTPMNWHVDAEIVLSQLRDDKSSEQVVNGYAWKAGQSLAAFVVKHMEKNLKKFSLSPVFPESFYPAYEPPPELDLIKRVNAKRILSTRGLLTANRTSWVFVSKKAPKELLTTLSAELKQEGWKEELIRIQDEGVQRLRLRQENKGWQLEIQTIDTKLDPWFASVTSEEREEEEHRYYINFQRLLTHEQSWPTLKTYLLDDPDASTAMVLAQYLPPNRAKDIAPVLENLAAAMTPRELFQLAKWLDWNFSQKQKDVRHYLIRSMLSQSFRGPNSELTEDMDNWVKSREELKELAATRYLPVNLASDEQKDYGILPMDKVVGKVQEAPINGFFAVSVTPDIVSSWSVYRDRNAPSSAPLVFCRTTFEKNSSSSRSIAVFPGAKRTTDLKGGDTQREVEIKVAEDGKSFTVLIK